MCTSGTSKIKPVFCYYLPLGGYLWRWTNVPAGILNPVVSVTSYWQKNIWFSKLSGWKICKNYQKLRSAHSYIVFLRWIWKIQVLKLLATLISSFWLVSLFQFFGTSVPDEELFSEMCTSGTSKVEPVFCYYHKIV